MNVINLGDGRYTYDCPHCADRLQLTTAELGKHGVCATCKGEITIPKVQDAMEPFNNPAIQYVDHFMTKQSLGTQLSSLLGLMMFFCGIIGLVYFQWFFDVSAHLDYSARALIGGDVANMHLMLVRLNGVITSATSVIAGVIIASSAALYAYMETRDEAIQKRIRANCS